MLGYQFQFQPAQHVRMAQAPAAAPAPISRGQKNMAIALGAAETGFGVIATWVGVRAGMHEKGVFSALGYAVAAGGGLFTLVNLLGTLGMIAHPEA